MTTATQWLANLAIEPITEEEQRQDEIERLQSELDLLWSRESIDDEPRSSAEHAGRAIRSERLQARIDELEGK